MDGNENISQSDAERIENLVDGIESAFNKVTDLLEDADSLKKLVSLIAIKSKLSAMADIISRFASERRVSMKIIDEMGVELMICLSDIDEYTTLHA